MTAALVDETSATEPTRRSSWRAHLVSLVVVALAASLQIGPALLQPSDRVAGERSDPAAEVWRFEEMASGRLGLLQPTTTPMVNAPEGATLRRPVEVTTVLIDLIVWPLERVADAATVRNMVLLIGVMLNGLAMLVLASVLKMPRAAGLVGAIAFMYAPPLVIEAQLHSALVYVATVPLAFAAGIRLHQRTDLASGALLGLAVGASCYINPYLPLYAGATAAVAAVTVLLHRRRNAVVPVVFAAATAVVVAAPALVLLTVRRSDTLESVRRSISEIDVYAATPLDIVRVFGPWYFGAAVLAIVCVFLVRLAEPAVRTTAALVALAGVLLAAGSETTVMGVAVPLPNRVLFSIYPAWRVVGRASVLVWFVVALALALGACSISLPGRPKLVARATLAVGLAMAVVVGASWRHGRPWFPVDETPALSAFLRERPGSLAEYPLLGLDHHASGPYLLRQTVHGRPLVNGNMVGTVGQDVSQAAGHLDDPQAPAGLALAGARTVVVHDDDGAPSWGRYLGTFDGARVFALDVMVDPAIVTWRGAHQEETSGVDRWRWLTDSTTVRVTSARPAVFRVRVELLAVGAVRSLRVGDTDVEIGPAEHVVEFCIASRSAGPAGLFVGTADVAADAPAETLGSADQRRAIARVRNASVVGRCEG